MASIKYGVYFYGSEHEEESLCYSGRSVFLVNRKDDAEKYCNGLRDEFPKCNYKVCILVVDDA